MTSRASPSSAQVDGIEPKSYGKDMPAGRIRLSLSTPSSGSNLYLLRLPLGVSMTTRTKPVAGSSAGNSMRDVLGTAGSFGNPRARLLDGFPTDADRGSIHRLFDLDAPRPTA